MSRRVVCPECGHNNSPHRMTCKVCRVNLREVFGGLREEAESQDSLLPSDERRRILDHEIAGLVIQGHRVLSQTDTTAQLVRPKQFSFAAALFFLVIGVGVGLLLYVLYYLAKQDEAVYLNVTPGGRVRRT